MGSITINQISATLILIAGMLGSMSAIALYFKKAIKKILEPVNNSIRELDINQCKNFLVRFIADVEQGNEIDEVEYEHAYNVYDRYTNELKQNSYIHARWIAVVEKRKD